jgi:hypothetical protein
MYGISQNGKYQDLSIGYRMKFAVKIKTKVRFEVKMETDFGKNLGFITWMLNLN